MAKKKKVTKVGPKELRAAAKELEEILAPEDDEGNPINIAKGTTAEVTAKVKEAAAELTTDDELSPELQAVLAGLNIIISDPEEEPEEEEEDPEEEEEDPDEEEEDPDEEEDPEEDPDEEEEDDDDEIDLEEEVRATKKLDELKDLVSIHPEFKSLKKGLDKYKGIAGPRELKAKMLKLLGIETTPAKPTKAKGPKKVTDTRMGSVAVALKKMKAKKSFSWDELSKETDAVFVAAGGSSNPRESKACAKFGLIFASVWEIVTQTDTDQYKKN